MRVATAALCVVGACAGDLQGTISPNPGPGSPTQSVSPSSTADSGTAMPPSTGVSPSEPPLPVSEPPPPLEEFCEESVLRNERIVPDMLIVLDKSGSMADEGRWNPSRRAVKTITGELEDTIRFGLMMFPNAEAGGAEAGCAAGQMYVPVDFGMASQIAGEVDAARSNGGTPTGETLQNALAEFTAEVPTPDTVPPPKYVLLATDGQPTCPAGEGYETTDADITLANDAITALKAAEVTTYVIGYDTQNRPELSSVLDGFAALGGTGTHRPVEDEDDLLAELRSIAGEIESCDYQLEAEPSDASYVQVTLDGTQINLNEADGWTLEGRTVRLQGAACDQLRDGGLHTLGVQVRCEVVTPI